MNSYYSNKLEGQHTRPVEIEQALAQQLDADEKRASKQRLALAHIDAEVALEATLPTNRVELYAPGFVQAIHGELYGRLLEVDRGSAETQRPRRQGPARRKSSYGSPAGYWTCAWIRRASCESSSAWSD